MRHAEAQEWLADLALEPGRLARIESDASPEAVALRRHLAECGACTAEVAMWRRTWAQVGAALDGPTASVDAAGRDWALDDATDAMPAPATLRAKTLAKIAAEGAVRGVAGPAGATRPREASIGRTTAHESLPADAPAPGSQSPKGRRRWVPWLAIAAALAIALGAGSLAWTRTRDLDRAQAENAGLAATMASLDRVLATPTHWTVTLRTPDGGDGGTMAWSGSEIAVITTALPGPTDGQSYRCWVERDGVRTPMGPMWFSGSTGYWAGAIGGWAPLLTPGSRLGVSLVPAGGGPATPVLVGTL